MKGRNFGFYGEKLRRLVGRFLYMLYNLSLPILVIILIITMRISDTTDILEGDFELSIDNREGKIYANYDGNYSLIEIEKDTYSNQYIISGDKREIIALPYGGGTYRIKLFELNNEQGEGVLIVERYIEIGIGDILNPFKGVSYYTDYENSVDILNEFIEDLGIHRKDYNNIDDFVYRVYQNILENIEYDKELKQLIMSKEIKTYRPNIDKTVNDKKGICVDKSSLMASILRLEEVPARIVMGYTIDGEYHAWVEAYYDGEWKSFDPTDGRTYRDNSIKDYEITNYY